MRGRLEDNVNARTLLEAEGIATLVGVKRVVLTPHREHMPEATIPLVQLRF